MIAGELYRVYPSDEAPSSSMDALKDGISRQELIDALVDLDLEYEREQEVLRRSSLGDMPKARLITRLKDQFRIRRQPYMRLCREPFVSEFQLMPSQFSYWGGGLSCGGIGVQGQAF